MKFCMKCGIIRELSEFPCYAPGKRRNECRVCAHARQKSYASVDYREKTDWFQPPRFNFDATYRAGTRCWCCRRNSKGDMLCGRCKGWAA